MNQYERNKEFGADLRQIIEGNLDLQKWEFRYSFENFGDNSGISFRKIIYDSEWCRIQFQYSYRGFPETNELGIYYGRLHALNDNDIMMWSGEKCYCWHGIGWAHIYFLDGFSPSETLEQKYHSQYPEVMDKIFKSDLTVKLNQEPIPKRFIMIEAVKWEYYGARLFEMFDVRRPDLWEKYISFLKEYYRLEDEYTKSKGNTPFVFDPLRYKVC